MSACSLKKILLNKTTNNYYRQRGVLYMKKIGMIIFLVVLLLFLLSCIPAAEKCSVDADCVPAQCCHPSSAANKENAPDCRGLLCGAVCEGPLDCGAGKIACVSNRCTIVFIKSSEV